MKNKTSLKNLYEISAGYYHSLVLKNDGTLWAAGDNMDGQLGLKDKKDKKKFIFIKVLDGVSAIAAGYFHSLDIKTNGTLWDTGWNATGQLGTGDNKSIYIWKQIK